MDSIFFDISIILGIAVGIAFIANLLKQHLIISYLFTGVICGPLFLNLVSPDHDFFQIFAKFGVVMLLFLVGLNLNVDYLKKIGKPSIVSGLSQVIFTSSLGFLIIFSFGLPVLSALFIAISITFSSTIIATKILSDKGDIGSVYGRYSIGLNLVQDMVAVVIMIILPAFYLGDALVVSFLSLIIKSSLFLLGVYLVTRFLLPFTLNKIAESKEFLFIFALAWCFIVSGVAEWSGLSLEVGALIAGLSLAASRYQLEINSRVRPLRDFFIALFFIILGSKMGLANLQEVFWPGLVVSMFILIGNPFILYTVFRFMRFTRKNSFLSSLSAAQVSEFGFVLLFLLYDMNLVTGTDLTLFTMVALITIFFSSYLITYNKQIFDKINPLFEKFFGKDKALAVKEDRGVKYDVLVFGYHRLGWKICDSLKESGVSFAVVDFDPKAIEKLRQRGIPYYFGDAGAIDFLGDIFSSKVKMVISTIPDFKDQMTLVQQLRKFSKKAIFIGSLSHIKHLNSLYNEGADFIITPHLLAGSWMKNLISENRCNKSSFRRLRNEQRKELKLKSKPKNKGYK